MMRPPASLVLASGSPRRRELLARLGWAFEVVVPDVDETPRLGEDPRAYVRRVAADKATAVAAAVAGERPDAVVLAADTTVELDGDVLGKPVGAADAVAMLRRLSARTHRVHTAVAVVADVAGGRPTIDAVTTYVTMTAITPAAAEWYVATGEPLDKAGAYALQGAGGIFVETIRGSVSNVVGLPLATVARLLGAT